MTGSRADSNTSGQFISKAEFNADGINVGFSAPQSSGFDIPEPIAYWGILGLGFSCSAGNPNCVTCYLDGFEHDCGQVGHLLDIGAAEQCPNNDCGPASIYDNWLHKFVGLAHWDPNAQSAGIGVGGPNGWLPMGINFVGGSTVLTGWGSSNLVQAVYGVTFGSDDPWNDDDVRPKLNHAQPQKPVPQPAPTPPGLPPHKDVEQPCLDRINDVRRDLNSIARMLHGKAGALPQRAERFLGAQIDPRGQSFGTAVGRLKSNGFVLDEVIGVQPFTHPDGDNYKKQFSDGLWYHVIVYYPGGESGYLFRPDVDPRLKTPHITAHCHATDPSGSTHLIDTIRP